MTSQRTLDLTIAGFLVAILVVLLLYITEPEFETVDYGCFSLLFLFLVTLGALMFGAGDKK